MRNRRGNPKKHPNRTVQTVPRPYQIMTNAAHEGDSVPGLRNANRSSGAATELTSRSAIRRWQLVGKGRVMSANQATGKSFGTITGGAIGLEGRDGLGRYGTGGGCGIGGGGLIGLYMVIGGRMSPDGSGRGREIDPGISGPSGWPA